MKKEKFYVVWAGVTPGIYTSWTECQLQTKGYEGAKFKSFDTREEAEQAFAASPYDTSSAIHPQAARHPSRLKMQTLPTPPPSLKTALP